MRCIIFGAAPCFYTDKIKKFIKNSDYIICADGGYNTALRCGITPHLCVGDMDSINEKINNKLTGQIKLPCKKDETDVMYAVKTADFKGANEIILFGVTGGRVDHTFGNLCILKYLCERKIKHKIIDENCEILMVSNMTVNIDNKNGAIVSVFPFGIDSCTVTYTGMEYSATSKTLYCSDPVGISNVVNAAYASIRVEFGTALIFIYD